MLSPADMLIIGAAALLFFGPDQLPKVARRTGQVVREVQATSQSFIREMERAADESDLHAAQAAYARGPQAEPFPDINTHTAEEPAQQPTPPEGDWSDPPTPEPRPSHDVTKPPDPPV
ncbi:MAG: twin-arginine translocase TatA/TatE family subunit [Candidatus Eremiobacteraeota bacterium]|nr:twin-arginine translocase TatA/TatE family subunit [Candidatus Eremiobacteraeota bacterium]MBC5803054.1 twin-arginine translocase TatA/TatE family subunit [Candidatus Eremiobacteraeota bacterium]MBC5821423.1 twin-arginine translocase TatA/TatE family subunit [Candidatus Eremiobacteraeota bacterium]